MEKVKASKEQSVRHVRNTQARSNLDQLIGQMQKQTPKGTALDTTGVAPQASCAFRIYCV